MSKKEMFFLSAAAVSLLISGHVGAAPVPACNAEELLVGESARVAENSPLARQAEGALNRILVGQSALVRVVVTSAIAGHNIYLESKCGQGKTTLAKSLAEVFGLPMARIQVTVDMLPKDVIGRTKVTFEFEQDGTKKTVETFVKGPLFNDGVVMADEFTRGSYVRAAFLQVLEEGTITLPDGTVANVGDDFFMIATSNPAASDSGTSKVEFATLDRFGDSATIPVLDSASSLRVMKGEGGGAVDRVMTAEQFRGLKQAVDSVPVSESAYLYANTLWQATQPGWVEHLQTPEEDPSMLALRQKSGKTVSAQYVKTGLSPRALKSLIETARAYALLEKSLVVTTDHIAQAWLQVTRHRLELIPGASAGKDGDWVAAQILNEVNLRVAGEELPEHLVVPGADLDAANVLPAVVPERMKFFPLHVFTKDWWKSRVPRRSGRAGAR